MATADGNRTDCERHLGGGDPHNPERSLLDAKAQVGAGGIGCEPASAASVAGAKILREEGIISADERVVEVYLGR